MNGEGRISTEGGRPLGQNPFAALGNAGLPVGTGNRTPPGENTGAAKPGSARGSPHAGRAPGSRGRVEVRRETGGRGGKTVTVIAGFTGIGLPEKERLAKQMRAACGCGGTVKDGAIEIQGDQREAVTRILAEAGFRPVLAGG